MENKIEILPRRYKIVVPQDVNIIKLFTAKYQIWKYERSKKWLFKNDMIKRMNRKTKEWY